MKKAVNTFKKWENVKIFGNQLALPSLPAHHSYQMTVSIIGPVRRHLSAGAGEIIAKGLESQVIFLGKRCQKEQHFINLLHPESFIGIIIYIIFIIYFNT